MSTLKQKKVFEKIIENHGNISKSMREVGYTDATAKNPSNLTKSDAWAELMEKYIPDDKLQKVLDEGLEANRVISAMNTGKQADGATADFIDVPDHAVRHKFLETALKLKNKFPEVTSKLRLENATERIIETKEYVDKQIQSVDGDIPQGQDGTTVHDVTGTTEDI